MLSEFHAKNAKEERKDRNACYSYVATFAPKCPVGSLRSLRETLLDFSDTFFSFTGYSAIPFSARQAPQKARLQQQWQTGKILLNSAGTR